MEQIKNLIYPTDIIPQAYYIFQTTQLLTKLLDKQTMLPNIGIKNIK